MRWAEELESGKYIQGKGLLAPEGKFCCLGVLCEMAAQEDVVQRYRDAIFLGDTSNLVEYVAYGIDADGFNDVNHETLPQGVMEWCDAGSPAPGFTGEKGERIFLTGMNDDGAPFTEIAAEIRKHWAEL